MRKDIRKPRRSVLYVPGSNAKALKKSSTLDVDSLIYDLEDSVALSAKEDARKAIIDILNSGVNKNKEQVIRINNFDSEEGQKDLKILENCSPDAILVPSWERVKHDTSWLWPFKNACLLICVFFTTTVDPKE